MLFTADLKAFSERLVAKSEVKEEDEVIKKEEDSFVETEVTVKQTTVLEKRVKREAEDEEKPLTEIKENVVRKTKRRRKD